MTSIFDGILVSTCVISLVGVVKSKSNASSDVPEGMQSDSLITLLAFVIHEPLFLTNQQMLGL